MFYQPKNSLVVDIHPDLSPINLVIQASDLFQSQPPSTDPEDLGEASLDEGELDLEDEPSPIYAELPREEGSHSQERKQGKCQPILNFKATFANMECLATTKKKNSKRGAKRKVYRQNFKDSQRVVRQKMATSSAITTEFSLQDVPVSEDALTATRTAILGNYPMTLEQVIGGDPDNGLEGYRVIEWDGMYVFI